MGDEVVVSVARVEEAPTLEIGEMLAEHGSVMRKPRTWSR